MTLYDQFMQEAGHTLQGNGYDVYGSDKEHTRTLYETWLEALCAKQKRDIVLANAEIVKLRIEVEHYKAGNSKINFKEQL